MKIGINATTYNRNGYGRFGEDLYKKLKEHGYSCIDYQMFDTDSWIYTSFSEELNKRLLHEKELAAEAEIEISQAHGPWRYPPRDFAEGDKRERMDKMKKSIQATAMLGCKNWVIHPLMPYGTSDVNTENASKTWEINLSFMSELLKTAKEYDVTICLENMPMREFSIATPTNILSFVKTMNDDHFKICLDTGHVAVFSNLSPGNAVRELGDEIRTLHVHDNKWGMDLHLMPYFGIIDWEDFAKALKEINFKGVFSLETNPSSKLTTPLFEDMSITIAKIAREIIKDI